MFRFYQLVAFFTFLFCLPQITSAKSQNQCLNFQRLSLEKIFSSEKKVYAHYFNRFPLSLDNRNPTDDYYQTQYLSPHGENNKWLPEGGFLRSRPLNSPLPNDGFIVNNLASEVHLALSRGISGFTYDILSVEDAQPGGYLDNMVRAAKSVDSRFRLILMPDMSSLKGGTTDVEKIIELAYDYPNLLRLNDGRLVVAPFLAESVPPAAWESMLKGMSDKGYHIALFPTFLSLKSQYLNDYGGIGVGVGTFGTPLPNQGLSVIDNTRQSHLKHELFMAGISGQGYRPKDFNYFESQGSLSYRNSWLGAIEGSSDLVQITTWNDFSESTQIIPYTDGLGSVGIGFFDITEYFSTWFISGQKPLIKSDTLYYFYRRESTSAPHAGSRPIIPANNQSPGVDKIELLAFLKAPGILYISINGRVYEKYAYSGIQSFTVPLDDGVPTFELKRHGFTVIDFAGATRIESSKSSEREYADLTYWSGGANELGNCS